LISLRAAKKWDFSGTVRLRRKENQKAKGKNLCAGPRAGWGRNLQGLAAIKTIVNDSIVNDSILERRRKPATSRNLRGAQKINL